MFLDYHVRSELLPDIYPDDKILSAFSNILDILFFLMRIALTPLVKNFYI